MVCDDVGMVKKEGEMMSSVVTRGEWTIPRRRSLVRSQTPALSRLREGGRKQSCTLPLWARNDPGTEGEYNVRKYLARRSPPLSAHTRLTIAEGQRAYKARWADIRERP